ncbi:unnamed protein product [Chrysodeixis includens]|uniref:MutL C-terminal dimerisation domain-containing protein n=1 Tax=Chrysodeixis includens TaxID=689277 RepID=A0A9P0BI08_CHRIL|nr:unnamed protein product [Chrysodeixis includens]
MFVFICLGRLIKRKKKSDQKIKNHQVSKLLTKEQLHIMQAPDHGHMPLRNANHKSKDDLSVEEHLGEVEKAIPVVDHSQNENLNAMSKKDNNPKEFENTHKNNLKFKDKTRKKKRILDLQNKKPIKHKYKHKTISKKSKMQNYKDHDQKTITETDLIYEKSKMVAQKAEELQRRDKQNVNTRLGVNPSTKYVDANYDHIFLAPKNRVTDNRKIITYKPKLFKTTYDLLQPIMTSQRGEYIMRNQDISEELYGENRHFNYRHKATSLLTHKLPKRCPLPQTVTCSEQIDIRTMQQEHSTYYTISSNKSGISDHYVNENCYKTSSQITMYDTVNEGNISYKDNLDISYNHERAKNCTAGDYFESILTYDSHHYHRNEFNEETGKTRQCSPQRKQNIRFISKQSKENFASVKIHRYKCRKQSVSKRTTCRKVNTKQVIDNSSYTIEYSESNVNEFNSVCKNDYIANETYYVKHTSQNYELDQDFGLTYAISPSILPCNIMKEHYNEINRSSVIESDELFDKSSNDVGVKIFSKAENENESDENNLNIVFVSKSQGSENEIEPLNLCETVLRESDSVEKEFYTSFHENNQLNDSLYNNVEDIQDTIYLNNGQKPREIIANHENVIEPTENVSHHFLSLVTKEPNILIRDPTAKTQMDEENLNKITLPDDVPIHGKEMSLGKEFIEMDANNFNLKNRPRFMPKGMSQIFENCRTKNDCNYILDEDYYEDSIYNNFVHDVKVNTEIYEPRIQNVEDLTTRDIHNFQTRVKKNNASLTFDERSLRNAKVLGQVDCKFIAAIVEEKYHETEEPTKYLVLFDQHAVHERIRLENNLAEYIHDDKWKSTPLDNVSLKLSNDEILYLHNYKDKFNQLGLQWTILNENEITINSIPKAILGKNLREVEKVIKAVKNLIVEEINAIKIQKGCLILYPKSIMDLVFSEACRYAIKFGDHLSKNDCVQLIQSLSACKTPFQCAHGRPVMAVIMDIKRNKREYKINKEKLYCFRSKSSTLLG